MIRNVFRAQEAFVKSLKEKVTSVGKIKTMLKRRIHRGKGFGYTSKTEINEDMEASQERGKDRREETDTATAA